jgi:hypothetical protein
MTKKIRDHRHTQRRIRFMKAILRAWLAMQEANRRLA